MVSVIGKMCGSLKLCPACCSALKAGNCLFAGSVMRRYLYASSSAIHLVYVFTGGCVTEASTCTWAHVQFGGTFAWIFGVTGQPNTHRFFGRWFLTCVDMIWCIIDGAM